MTPESFIKWLDEEIEHCHREKIGDPENGSLLLYQNTRQQTLEEIKEKFITLTPPPTTLS